MTKKLYSIETERLILRCYQDEDAVPLHEELQKSKNHLIPWMVWATQLPGTMEERKQQMRIFREQFSKGEDFAFAIILKEANKLIGSTGLHPRLGKDELEIGYWIGVDHIGKGYATEASEALTIAAFELHLVNKVEIHCAETNIRSQSIPSKLGYQKQPVNPKKSYQQIWVMDQWCFLKEMSNFKAIKVYDKDGNQLSGTKY